MRLVDDQGVVAQQPRVMLHLGEQDAVGHELDQSVVARRVGEADLVADCAPRLSPKLLGDPFGDGPGGEPARLGVTDLAGHAAAEFQADLRNLGGLA